MDGENNGKPYFLMDDLGGKPTIFGNIHIYIYMNQMEAWTWAHHELQDTLSPCDFHGLKTPR